MLGTFKANYPYNNFLLFVYGFLLKFHYFLSPKTPTAQSTDNFLFVRFLNALSSFGNNYPVIYPVITYILLYIQAISFNRAVNDQRLLQKANYLPAMSYLLITSLFAEWNTLTSSLVINTLLIWVWSRMSRIHNIQKPKANLFNVGAVIGIATFFYFPSLAFAALVIMGLMIMRAFRLDEWIMVAVGIITPYYFLYAYLFITDKIYGYKLPAFAVGYPRFSQSYWTLAAMILVLVAFLIGGYYARINMRRLVVQTRKSWNLLLLYLVVAVFVPFVNATHTLDYWILSAIPLSAIIACAFFYPSKKWLPHLLHWAMIALVIVMGYFI